MKPKIDKSILILVALLLIPIYVNAENFIYKQSDEIDLNIFCFNETNAACSSATTCHITILNPNSTVLINNGTMEFQGAYFNYSLESPNETSSLGTYTAVVSCEGTESDGFSTFDYLVTRSGKKVETGEAILTSLLSLAVLFFFILSLYASVRIPYKNPKSPEGFTLAVTKSKYIKMAMILISYSLLIWFLNLLIGISNTFMDLGIFEGFVTFMFNILIGGFTPVAVVFFFWFLVEFVRDINVKKQLKFFDKK